MVVGINVYFLMLLSTRGVYRKRYVVSVAKVRQKGGVRQRKGFSTAAVNLNSLRELLYKIVRGHVYATFFYRQCFKRLEMHGSALCIRSFGERGGKDNTREVDKVETDISHPQPIPDEEEKETSIPQQQQDSPTQPTTHSTPAHCTGTRHTTTETPVDSVEREMNELISCYNLTKANLKQVCNFLAISEFIAWYKVGPHLPNISLDDIDDIKRDGYDQADRRRMLMQRFKDKNGEKAINEVMLRAMLKSGMRSNADRLCELVSSEPQPTASQGSCSSTSKSQPPPSQDSSRSDSQSPPTASQDFNTRKHQPEQKSYRHRRHRCRILKCLLPCHSVTVPFIQLCLWSLTPPLFPTVMVQHIFLPLPHSWYSLHKQCALTRTLLYTPFTPFHHCHWSPGSILL